MKQNNFTSYALKLPMGQLCMATFSTKRDAITYLTGYDPKQTGRSAEWGKFYRIGWRVVKVLVTEITGREAVFL